MAQLNWDEVGRRIQQLRGTEKQIVIAEILGIAQNTLSAYENGKVDIPTEKLDILSRHWNVTVDYLLGRSNDQDPQS